MKRLLAVAACLLVQVFAQQKPGCKIDITKLSEPAPLVLNPYTYKYIYPPADNLLGDQTIILAPGETILVACPGSTVTEFPFSIIYATCNTKNQLIAEDKHIYFNNLKCQRQYVPIIRNTTKPCDGDAENSRIIEVGYLIGVGLKWVSLIDVCFNYKTRNTFWTKFDLTKSLTSRQYGSHDIIEQPEIYNLKTSVRGAYLYSMDTINKQVGLDINSRKYLSLPFYRTRLTTQTEVYYSSQNEAVAVAINTFPEWPKQCYNWRSVDVMVQNYGITHHVDLEVYTGTHGTVTVTHEKTFEDVTLYLYYAEDDISAMPIPGLMWRLAYEPISQKAVVFLTVNVPIKTLYEKHIICEDISDQISWKPWIEFQAHDFTCGYSYTCDYASFKRAMPNAPDLKVSGLLL